MSKPATDLSVAGFLFLHPEDGQHKHIMSDSTPSPTTDSSEVAAQSSSNPYSANNLRVSAVRAIIKENTRRLSPEFLKLLDQHVRNVIEKACATNTNKKTLDVDVAVAIGIVPRPSSTEQPQ